jgi:lipopolysaccharide biosynthesis protein
MNSLSFFIHVYYAGSWKLILEKCADLMTGAENIIVTACHDEVISEIKAETPEAVVLKVPNKGKDIGGKLAAISYYLNFCRPTAYLAFLHDKISPQTLNAEYWFDRLYEIFSEKKFSTILSRFETDKKTGLAGSKSFLKNEYNKTRKRFDTTNNEILQELIKRYDLGSDEHNYIGGTIFIVRNEIFTRFFSQHSALQIRASLETGNVLDLDTGTQTHSWERLFCLIAQNQGYKVIGV